MYTLHKIYILALLSLFTASNSHADSIRNSRRTAVVEAVERIQPSVVSLHVRYRERVSQLYQFRGDPFLNFFSPFYYVVPQDRNRVSTGSGFVVDNRGYIITNSHVIGDPHSLQRITVSLPEPDGRTFKAHYVASDINFDLAVLKVDEADLPVAPLGNSDDILVGEWALAIGNPFDLGPTVSIGVVSALDRDIPEPQGEYYYRDMIQTDAAINPGNSGGPLANASGEVIGINTFILSDTGGSQGLGFAIPIERALKAASELRAYGRVRRVDFSGLQFYRSISDEKAASIGLEEGQGLMVADPGIAAEAGLRRDDVILDVDHKPVRNFDDAQLALVPRFVGDHVTLGVWRNERRLELQLVLTEAQEQ